MLKTKIIMLPRRFSKKALERNFTADNSGPARSVSISALEERHASGEAEPTFPEMKVYSAPSFFSFENVEGQDPLEVATILSHGIRELSDSEESKTDSLESTQVSPQPAICPHAPASPAAPAPQAASAPSHRPDFAGVKEVLLAVWTDRWQSVGSVEKLCKTEAQLVEFILQRKKILALNQTLQGPNEVLNTRSSKRLEEKMKYVFKRVFKHMIGVPARAGKSMSKTDKINLSYALFRAHFQPLVEGKSIPVERFMIPQTVKSEHNYKTFCAEYIRLLKLSPSFIAFFREHMAAVHPLIVAEIRYKINRLIDKIGANFLEVKDFEAFNVYFARECRRKLPWTVQDINDAFETVERMLKN